MDSFSVLEVTLKAVELAEGSPPELELGTDDASTSRFVADPRTLLHWCRVNESLVIDEEIHDARVYAGFERLSRIRPVQDRYARMGHVAGETWVFGEPDHVPVIPGVERVPVGRGPLLREWFLLVAAPSYACLLAARDLDGLDDRPARARRFEGVKTFSHVIVRDVEQALRRSLPR